MWFHSTYTWHYVILRENFFNSKTFLLRKFLISILVTSLSKKSENLFLIVTKQLMQAFIEHILYINSFEPEKNSCVRYY